MATAVCRNCGRTFTRGEAAEFESLAETPGAAHPPEAAGLLSGATPFDATLGGESGPVEYAEAPARRDDDLCPTCRARRQEAR